MIILWCEPKVRDAHNYHPSFDLMIQCNFITDLIRNNYVDTLLGDLLIQLPIHTNELISH